MIKSNIQVKFLHQHDAIQSFTEDIFVADYTEQSKSLVVKRSVEFFSANCPMDINYFSIKNANKFAVDGIEFNNLSFVCGAGNTKSQCEAVFFPSVSNSESWILFCELKYSCLPKRNYRNLKEAITQLFKTRYYYLQENVIEATNCSYLIASLPMQIEPFANFSLSQPFITKLKRKKNIMLRTKNTVEIQDDKLINV